MKNIQLALRPEYQNKETFELIEEGIYLNRANREYVITLAFELEAELGETTERQYPLEDLLEKYFAYVTEFIQDEPHNKIMILELSTGDSLAEMIKLKAIIGKRVYNQKFFEGGSERIRLMIE